MTYEIETGDGTNRLLLSVTEYNGIVEVPETKFYIWADGDWRELPPPFPLTPKDVQNELNDFLGELREMEEEEPEYKGLTYEEESYGASVEATRDFERDQRL